MGAERTGTRPRLRQAAGEAFGLIGAARALVLRRLRIWAERPRADDAAVRHLRGDDFFGRDAVLPPLLEWGQRIEDAGAFAAATMPHAGRHVEAHGILDPSLAQHAHQLLVIVHRR